MFERPASGERAILVQLDLGQDQLAERQDEAVLLIESAGASVEDIVNGRRARPDPALFAGSGKVEEIAAALQTHRADLVVFNHSLTPAQQRNLERALHCRVIDRTALILDIFALRARSHEGKLQVELAQLDHLSTRLVRGWTHLERQKGGIGLRGPGETQLETDRRLLAARVKALRGRLAKIGKQRDLRRRARARRDVLSVSIVGYTNAGKSTLFNALTKAGSYVADQLFATLDTTSRRLYVGEGGNVVLSDTVGFVRDLPHALVEAFKATLEETANADLLLHVVDAASEDRDAQIDAVNVVLDEIGTGDLPQILIYNKIDLTGMAAEVVRDECGTIQRIFLSARSGAGVDQLRDVLGEVARRAAIARMATPAGEAPAPADANPWDHPSSD